MSVADPCALSAGALAAAIRGRRISAREALEAAFARAESVNPVLNAVLSVEAEAARAAAACVDSGDISGPLAGVPLAHKDMFDRAGALASWGAKIHAAMPPRRDATVLARLAAAGSVRFAALNMAEFAFGITGHNYCVGHCHNPHNPAHITGGSSSGSAAAVAAGVTPFALGSDTGGSVRMPAACCGIAGLRPTWGLISRAGAMPLAPSLDTVGVLARDVADIALALSILAGADPEDATAAAPPADYLSAIRASVTGLRIGIDRSLFEMISPEVTGLLETALAALREAGAVEVAVAAPDLELLDGATRILMLAEASTVHANWMRTRPRDYSEQVRARLEDGFAIPAVEYLAAQRARARATRTVLAGPLAEADVMVLPVLDRPVPTIADTDVGGGAAMAGVINGMLRFTRPIGYLGLPVIALPTGRDSRGLPNGMQVVGRPYAEPTLLALGAAYQRIVGVPVPVIPRG